MEYAANGKVPLYTIYKFLNSPPQTSRSRDLYEPNQPTILFSLPFLWQDTGGCLLLLSENITQWTDDMGCASLHNNGILAESSRCETMKSLLEIKKKRFQIPWAFFWGEWMGQWATRETYETHGMTVGWWIASAATKSNRERFKLENNVWTWDVQSLKRHIVNTSKTLKRFSLG